MYVATKKHRDASREMEIHIKNSKQRMMERLSVLEKARMRKKELENQFIDEFPELSLKERKKMSWKIARVETEW
jgi:GMP synthase PP-ATPase subunit